MDLEQTIHDAQPANAALALLPYSVPFGDDFDFGRLPAGSGVFLIETGGEPFLGKSASLRRRIARLLGEPETQPQSSPSTGGSPPAAKRPRLNLRHVAIAIHYQYTGSAFENSVLLYRVLRAQFPSRYRGMLRLRVPPLLKVNLDNEWPRAYVTRRLGRKPGVVFGPFPNRPVAEKTAAAFLDLFQVRRCVEAIRPDPAHPGCIYGEMNMCLRPCQAACAPEPYREEVARLEAFLSSGGASLVREFEAARDRASDVMDFEEAARLHKRLDKVKEALKQPPDLATDLDRLHGMVVQPAAGGNAVILFPVWRGYLQEPVRFEFELVEGRPVSMDARLRDLLAGIRRRGGPGRLRGEHLALLSRWYYRGTRKGEFIAFESFDKPPFRKLVNAIHRVSKTVPGEPADTR